MGLNLREVPFRTIFGVEKAVVAAAIYFIILALSPQTIAVAEAYAPISAEALAAAVVALSFFSGFFKGTVFGKAADAARDLFIMAVFMLMHGEVSFTIQDVHIAVDISLIRALLMAACALSFASTVISAVDQLAEKE